MAFMFMKAMAPHSSTLAWKISWTKEPGGLQSMGSRRVGHDWETSLSLFTFMHWKGKWQPTPVFLPGESQGRGSLVGCRLWDRAESNTTDATHQQQQQQRQYCWYWVHMEGWPQDHPRFIWYYEFIPLSYSAWYNESRLIHESTVSSLRENNIEIQV